jgi:hypothetical protein
MSNKQTFLKINMTPEEQAIVQEKRREVAEILYKNLRNTGES